MSGSLKRTACSASTPENGVKIAYVIQITKYDGINFEKLSGFDEELLSATLRTMNYQEVRVQQGSDGQFTKENMKTFLEGWVLAQFPKNVGGVMIVLTCHGDGNGIYTSDGSYFPYTVIEHCIGNETLRGLSKVIIYSCCNGYATSDVEKKQYEEKFGKTACTCAAARASWRVLDCHTLRDQIAVHEAPKEYNAFGNVFLQQLCSSVDQLKATGIPAMDLLQLLVAVNANFVESSDESRLKRLAQTTHTLTKLFSVKISGTADDTLPTLEDPDPVTSATWEAVDNQLKCVMSVDRNDRDNYKFSCLSASLHNSEVLREILEELDRVQNTTESADKGTQTTNPARQRTCSSSATQIVRRMLFTP